MKEIQSPPNNTGLLSIVISLIFEDLAKLLMSSMLKNDKLVLKASNN